MKLDELCTAAVRVFIFLFFRLRRRVRGRHFAFEWLWCCLFVKIEVAIAFMEFTDFGLTGEVACPLGVAFADFNHECGEFPGFRVSLGEVFLKVASVPANRIAKFGEALKEFEDFLQLAGTENFAVRKIFDLHFIRTDADEDFVQLRIVIDVFLALLAFDQVKGRLGNVDFALFNKFHHVPAEKSEQKRANVRTIDIGICHNDDATVAKLLDIEAALAILLGGSDADASADRRDEGLDFGVLKDFVEAGLLDIDDFAFDRQNRLVSPVAALLRGAAGRVTFDHIEFGEVWVALGAIRQLPRESTACERTLANGLTSLAGSFAGASSHEALLDNALAHIRILVEMQHEAFVGDRAHNALHLGRYQLHLGLGFEAWIGMLHAHDSGQAFKNIVAGDGDILFLQEGVILGILIDRASQ